RERDPAPRRLFAACPRGGRAAQRRRPGPGPGHARPRQRGAPARRAVLPRPGLAAADARVGLDGEHGHAVLPALVDGHVSRLRDPVGRAGVQLPRRQPARRPRPPLVVGGAGPRAMSHLLAVEGLTVRLPTTAGLVTVVEGLDYEVEVGQVFGIAGESGSGKTISVLALLGLLPGGAVVEGSARFDGRDLLRLGSRSLRDVRGAEIAMVFQDPM